MKSVIRKEIFLCLLSVSLLILSFPNSNFWILAWFGFVPLFFALQGKSKGKAFLLSYLTGVTFWFGIIYWLIHVTLPGMILLVLYLALYFALFGLIISAISHQPSAIKLLFIPSVWVILEYIRSHLFTGFPWALLGYSQYLNLPIIQIADIAGVWGVSFLVMTANAAIYSVVSCQLSVVSRIKKHIMPILCIILTLVYGFYKLNHKPQTKDLRPLKVSVIQGNIPQELKWNAGSRDFIIDKYLTLTSQAAEDNPDLIIWPEAALPVVLEEESVFFERIKKFTGEIKIPLLLGAVISDDSLYYNSALLVSSKDKPLNKYYKLHLVPFGEYIPLKRIFTFLEAVVPIGDFTPGEEYTLFEPSATILKPSVKFAVLICFEDIFPELAQRFVKKGANFLINITNDAWFGRTSAPYQHLCASVFRAVENRINLARCANTGISGFISPKGDIVSLVQDKSNRNIFVSGYKTQEVIVAQGPLSFYSRYGDVFMVGCFLLVLCAIISYFRKKISTSAPCALRHQ